MQWKKPRPPAENCQLRRSPPSRSHLLSSAVGACGRPAGLTFPGQLPAPAQRPRSLGLAREPCLLENTVQESEGERLDAAISNQQKNTEKKPLPSTGSNLEHFVLFLLCWKSFKNPVSVVRKTGFIEQASHAECLHLLLSSRYLKDRKNNGFHPSSTVLRSEYATASRHSGLSYRCPHPCSGRVVSRQKFSSEEHLFEVNSSG